MNHFKIAIFSGVTLFCLSACATKKDYPAFSYVNLPKMPLVQPLQSVQKRSGKLVIERFKDYRLIDPNASPKWEDCNKALEKAFFVPVDKVDCKHEVMGTIQTHHLSTNTEQIVDAIPSAIAEDIRQRGLFDSVEFVPEAKEDYPDASWRMVGLIVQADETLFYNGYYLPVVNSYLFMFGAPYGGGVNLFFSWN